MNLYETKYGAQFGAMHSFRDFGLYPTSKPVIEPPQPRTFFVEVPGMSGSLDLTEVLTGGVTYDDRKGKFSYYIIGDREHWDTRVEDITAYLHGRRMNVILDEDLDHFYNGRLSISEVSYDEDRAKITIEGIFKPYRYAITQYSGNNWLWDQFSFASDVAREYYHINIEGEEDIMIAGINTEAVSPVFILNEGNLEVEYGDHVFQMSPGENIFYQIIIGEKDIDVKVRGFGNLTIEYLTGA